MQGWWWTSVSVHACVCLVSGEVDPDRLELARALSTQAGMQLENVCSRAILVGGMSAADLARTVGEVRSANRKVEVLLAAAAVLLEK